MADLIDLNKSEDVRDQIHQTVSRLVRGDVVAIPTESLYVVAAHALNDDAVGRFRGMFNGTPASSAVLALKSSHEAMDYVPDMSEIGRKLVRRCWPGPITILFPNHNSSGLLGSLPSGTQRLWSENDNLPICVPAHSVMQEILNYLPAPLILLPDRLTHSGTAQEIADQLGDQIDLILDDGPSRYGEPTTIVRVNKDWNVVESGVVSETTIRRLTSEVFLFVCTGNTCRSPMAESLFRKLLAEKLKCQEDELVDRGYVIGSAGIAAGVGSPANPYAIQTMADMGIDLRSHESQPLSLRLLEQADRVFVLTRSHGQAILTERPEYADRIELLSRSGLDIADPIGGSLDEYRLCSAVIERELNLIIAELFP